MTDVHLLGNEICPSGSGGSNCNRSALPRASTTPGAARQFDRANARMRYVAAHQNGVQHARQDEIGNELPLAPRPA